MEIRKHESRIERRKNSCSTQSCQIVDSINYRALSARHRRRAEPRKASVARRGIRTSVVAISERGPRILARQPISALLPEIDPL